MSINHHLKQSQKNFQLSRQDIRLANAYENLKSSPTVLTHRRVPVKKSVIDKELENYKITRLNDLLNETHIKMTDSAQDFSSKWAVVNKALEDVKNAVDLTDFMAFDDFNKLYQVSISAMDDYCNSIKATIEAIDEFCLTMKAIVPNDNI